VVCITKSASALVLCLAITLSVGQAQAVDFVFFYDDPAGFGFFDPTILSGDTISVGERRRAAMEADGELYRQASRSPA
jgi:hypothetical protein